MRVIIDADGCPVVKIAADICQKNRIECIIVCDSAHEYNIDGVQTITVSKGADSVDYAIVNMLNIKDLVITQDYGLAAMCLSKNADAINQDGMIYNKDNIDQLLQQRYHSQKMRKAKKHLKGPKKRTSEQNQTFAINFEALITNTK